MSQSEQKIYTIGKMDCANCAREVEEGVGRLDGVEAVQVSFANSQMRLTGDVPFDTLKQRVEALGKSIALYDKTAVPTIDERHPILSFFAFMLSSQDGRIALSGGLLILLTFLASLLGLPERLTAVAYSLSMLYTLWPILKSGINGVLINRRFNINLLMSIAAIGAIVIGEYLESAIVIFLFSVGEAMEGFTAARARRSIQGLMALKPKTAVLLTQSGEEVVPIEALQLGQRVLVKPGEQVPMDGRVVEGSSSIDQSTITGESIPVHKAEGDDVFAGTLNGSSPLTIEISRLAEDNTLNRIIQLVQEAQENKANSQRLIDRFAAWYTPAVVVLAFFVATLPPLLFGEPFLDTAVSRGWLYRALAMLVIACPCALIISTPVTVISAITAAAKRGILIKGGVYLEQLSQIQAFAFDKTGTLTEGKPEVLRVQGAECALEPDCECCDEVLALATAVEKRASHPLAEAVVRAGVERQLDDRFAPATAVEQLTGQGVRGHIEGREVIIGSHTLFDETIPHSDAFCEVVRDIEAGGGTAVLLAEDGKARGVITLADMARSTAAQVIFQLNKLDISTVMLTGDNPHVAQRIGEQVGVTEVKAGLLPQEKLTAVELLKSQFGGVAMVGDGINDTPALTAATIGIAMGGAGSPQALESADIALMADDLSQLPFAIRLARFASRLIKLNVIISFGVKLIFLTLAFLGMTSLWLAILADVGMTLLVTLNGLRPLRFK